jgi:hypothetical protein
MYGYNVLFQNIYILYNAQISVINLSIASNIN